MTTRSGFLVFLVLSIVDCRLSIGSAQPPDGHPVHIPCAGFRAVQRGSGYALVPGPALTLDAFNRQSTIDNRQSAFPDDLGQRLIRKSASDADEDLMAAIARMMKESQDKMEIEFDAGQDTQALQRDILARLDDAIRVAAAQRRPVSAGSRKAVSDKRRMPPRGKPKPDGAAGAGRKGGKSAGSTSGDAGTGDGQHDPARSGGQLKESRRGWGHLPDRQRDEVLQGKGERFLEKYRTWIEKYYKALQESGQ